MRSIFSAISKKLGVLGLLLAGAFFANAQSTIENPAWMVSKDVQRIANQKLFEDQNLRNSHIQAKHISPTWMISKGVHRTKDQRVLAKGNIKSVGIPVWTISKGVQQIGRK